VFPTETKAYGKAVRQLDKHDDVELAHYLHIPPSIA